MKTQKKSIVRTLLPIVLCCALALPVLGVSASAVAAEKKQGIPAKAEQVIQYVNINKADAKTLSQVLKGIGLKRAKAIVNWRQRNGKFTNVGQLMEVKGIGEKTISSNRSRIKL